MADAVGARNSDAGVTAEAAAVYYPPVVDVGGQIYSLLNQIIGILTELNTAVSALGSGASDSAALAQALTGIAAASATLTAAVSAHSAPSST